MSLAWYVLHSKPNKEDFLFSQLQSRDIQVFYPRLRVKPVNPRARKVKPFFPGYLFVHVDLEHTPLSNLAYVPGLNRVVSFDDRPAIIPEDAIATIKNNVERINRAKANQNKGLKHGDTVLVLEGPFKGYKAIFDTALPGTDRVHLLIKLLHGQQRRVQVSAGVMQPQNPST